MRPTKDQWAIALCNVTAMRATCARRQVGAVILSEEGHVLSTGYNGVPAGMPHCIDSPCAGACYPSGTGLDACDAIHAEVNAIAHLREPRAAHTMYVTAAPCVACTKVALATGIKRIVFLEDYPTSGRTLWEKAGRAWEKL